MILTNAAAENANTIQVITLAVLSSGLVTGLFTLFTKRLWSPESKNELAKLGNEFASQLLKDAKVEREELRKTIQDLEKSNDVKKSTINRLERLIQEKDDRIIQLEEQQKALAEKLQRGEQISLQDILGPRAPDIAIQPNGKLT